MSSQAARWAEVEILLRDAHSLLPSKGSGAAVPVGLLTGTRDEFDEFLAHNELELAWDALAEVASQESALPDCWNKLAEAAALMQLPEKEALARQRASTRITSDQALAIARAEGERAYRDLSAFRVVVSLEPDGWHVEYYLKDPKLNGGGPHYIVDVQTGAILSKKYYQ
jgi:hypothetical protein